MNAPQRFTPDPLVEAALEFAEGLKIDVPWETIAQGQIIMNPPVGFLHADRADKIGTAIEANLPGWSVWPELGLHTADGVKSPELSAAPPGFEVVADSRGFLLRASRVFSLRRGHVSHHQLGGNAAQDPALSRCRGERGVDLRAGRRNALLRQLRRDGAVRAGSDHAGARRGIGEAAGSPTSSRVASAPVRPRARSRANVPRARWPLPPAARRRSARARR
jgi:hypothetical protein